MGRFLQGRLESQQPPDAEPGCTVGLLRPAMGKERTDGNAARQWRRTIRYLGKRLRRLDDARNSRRFERIDLRRAEHQESKPESLSTGPEQLRTSRGTCLQYE